MDYYNYLLKIKQFKTKQINSFRSFTISRIEDHLFD